jgi:hypothetical protein
VSLVLADREYALPESYSQITVRWLIRIAPVQLTKTRRQAGVIPPAQTPAVPVRAVAILTDADDARAVPPEIGVCRASYLCLAGPLPELGRPHEAAKHGNDHDSQEETAHNA